MQGRRHVEGPRQLLTPNPLFHDTGGHPLSPSHWAKEKGSLIGTHTLVSEEQGEAVRDQAGPAQALTSRDVRGGPRDILDLRLQLPRWIA